jgi:hypothetical protein
MIPALKTVLKELKERGYKFSALPTEWTFGQTQLYL